MALMSSCIVGLLDRTSTRELDGRACVAGGDDFAGFCIIRLSTFPKARDDDNRWRVQMGGYCHTKFWDGQR